MKTFTSAFVLIALLFTHLESRADEPVGSLMFIAHMTGSEVVPAVSTNAEGLGVFILNSTHDTLCITISISKLDAITGIYVQSGLPGAQGPVILNLSPYREGNQVFANITGSALSTTLIKNLLAGRFYLNAHTPTHIDGEIRGQILPETNETYVVRLNGLQAAPANNSAGVGLGVFVLSSNKKSIRFTMLSRNLTGQVGAVHLHTSLLGAPGPIALNLTPYGALYLYGTVDSSSIVDYPTFLLNLRSGFVYIDLHTDSFPNGELRGQLLRERNIGFYTTLYPSQEVPPITNSTALGLAYFTFNATFDTLRYDAVMGGFSSQPFLALIQSGYAGTNGPALVDISDGIQGNLLSGFASDTNINVNLLRDMLSAHAYLNIGTLIHPDGAVRGQLKTTQRTGYSFRLTSGQEIPADTSQAYGSGFMSVGPDSTDARFMFLYGGLSGPATGAHFHLGGFGQLGPVVFDVTPFTTNNTFVMGNWVLLDTINTFTAVLFELLNHDSLYMNMRTLQYPEGEVRGQLIRGLICNLFVHDTTLTTTDDAIDYNREMNVYPNPSSTGQNTTMRFVSSLATNGVLNVYDVVGKKVIERHIALQAGTNLYSMDLSEFAAGIYSVQLIVGNNRYAQNMSKK